MSLTLSEYLLRDFAVEHVDSVLLELGNEGSVRFPAVPRTYFHLVLSGTARLVLEESSQLIELQAGDFALLLYGAAHTVGCVRTRRPHVLHTCDRWLEKEAPAALKLCSGPGKLRALSGCLHLTRTLRSAPVSRALPHLLRYPAGARGADNGLFSDLDQVETACRGPGASSFVFALAQLYMVQTLRQVNSDMRQEFPVQIGAPDSGRMAVVVRKIRAHPEKRWTVASLAHEVGCSRSSFAAKFQAYAGIGPIKYVARSRLNHAAAMLKGNPELPLWEVAKRVGYDAQGSFTRAFKAQFGVSPRGYVKQIVETNGNSLNETAYD